MFLLLVSVFFNCNNSVKDKHIQRERTCTAAQLSYYSKWLYAVTLDVCSQVFSFFSKLQHSDIRLWHLRISATNHVNRATHCGCAVTLNP